MVSKKSLKKLSFTPKSTMAATNSTNSNSDTTTTPNSQFAPPPLPPSRYESQKRRDWKSFGQYLKNHRPPLTLSRCSGAHVLEFLRYLDQFGKTKVHLSGCPFFGHPRPPAPCPCPLRQAWGSLDALVGRLRAAFEENGGQPEVNPFGARAVRLYLREIRESQAKARGIAYEKKKRKPHQTPAPPPLQTDPPTISTTTIDLGIGGTDSLRLLPVGFELNLLNSCDIGVEGLNDEVNVGSYRYYDLLHGNLFGEVGTTTTAAATAAVGVNGMTVADGQSSFSGAYNLLIR